MPASGKLVAVAFPPVLDVFSAAAESLLEVEGGGLTWVAEVGFSVEMDAARAPREVGGVAELVGSVGRASSSTDADVGAAVAKLDPDGTIPTGEVEPATETSVGGNGGTAKASVRAEGVRQGKAAAGIGAGSK